MIRVAVTGAKGRMGSSVVDAVSNAPDMEVVAQLDEMCIRDSYRHSLA